MTATTTIGPFTTISYNRRFPPSPAPPRPVPPASNPFFAFYSHFPCRNCYASHCVLLLLLLQRLLLSRSVFILFIFSFCLAIHSHTDTSRLTLLFFAVHTHTHTFTSKRLRLCRLRDVSEALKRPMEEFQVVWFLCVVAHLRQQRRRWRWRWLQQKRFQTMLLRLHNACHHVHHFDTLYLVCSALCDCKKTAQRAESNFGDDGDSSRPQHCCGERSMQKD